MSLHRFPCDDWDCPHCTARAEERAEDTEPEYDETAAENSFEAASGW